MFKFASIACTFALVAALCVASSVSSFAQDQPPATPDAPARDPQKTSPPTLEAARDLLEQEKFEEAAAAFHKIVTADPDDARAWQLLGFSLHASGNLTDALPAHLMAAEFPQTASVASYNVACVYSLRKKNDNAFKWLAKARDAGFRDREHIEADSDMEHLRSDPRYAEFLDSLPAAESPGDGAVKESHVKPGEDHPAPGDDDPGARR